MQTIDRKNLIGGALLVMLGLFASVYALLHYNLGTLQRMGPGMVPTAMGLIVAGLGATMMVVAVISRNEEPEPLPHVDWGAFGVVMLALAIFFVATPLFGIAPATVAMALVTTLLSGKFTFLKALIYSVLIAAAVVGIFRYAIGLYITVFRWPF